MRASAVCHGLGVGDSVRSAAKSVTPRPSISPFDRVAKVALGRRGFRFDLESTERGELHRVTAKGGGKGLPLVFVHGLGASFSTFSRLMQDLRPHVAQISAIDLPGHGYSSAQPRDPETGRVIPEQLDDMVASSLHAVCEGPSVLIGNSLGGMIATRYAARFPENVAALVLISPAGLLASPRDVEDTRAVFQVGDREAADRLMKRLMRQPPRLLGPLLRRGLQLRFKSRYLQELLAQSSADRFLSEQEVRSLVPPVLLVWGAYDGILPAHQLERWVELLPPSAEIERWPHVGHIGHAEDRARMVARIRRFLDAVPTRR